MTRVFSWFLLLLLFGGFAAAVVYALTERVESGKDLPAFSVYSDDADGLAAAARLVHLDGWHAVAVTRPVDRTREHGLLILDEPQGASLIPGEPGDLSDIEVKNLLRWVEAGNTLFFCCGHMTALHRELKVSCAIDNQPGADSVVSADLNSLVPYLAGVGSVRVVRSRTLQGAGLPLWWVGDNPGAVLIQHGTGRVLVVADPSLLTSRGLSRGDNVVFFHNVVSLHAQGGRVYFDEYDHGLRSGGDFFAYLQSKHMRWALLPIFLVVAVALWRAMIRLGPAVPRTEETHADAVDYASAVARIYHRAGTRRLLARPLARGFLTTLTRVLHLRRSALPAEILAAWRQRYPKGSTERLQRLLRGLAELRRGDVSDRQMLAWARAFDQFTKEVATR